MKPNWPQRIALIGAILVSVFPALAVGGVHLWAIAGSTALALLLFGFVLYRRVVVDARSMRIGWVGAAFLVCTVWTALQLLPLPPGLVAWLSPKAHETLDFTLGAFGLYGPDAWRPLSLDPPATAQELLRLCGLTVAYLAARNGFSERRDANRVYIGIAALGVLLVAIGAVQKVSGSPSILGLYPSPMTQNLLFTSSTFVNPNHLAGLLGLGGALAFGLALSEEVGKATRITLAVGGVLCSVGILFSLSRAGILAFGLGQLVLLVLLLRARSGKTRRVFWLVGLGLLALLVGGVALFDRLVAELSPSNVFAALETDLKVQMWRDAWPLAQDFLLTGVGKGAFPAVFPLYQSNIAQYTYWHVENLPLQTLVDFGVVVGGFLLLNLLVALGRLVTRRLSAATAGAAAALVTLGLHNLADFNLEVAGVAFPAVIVLGLALRRDRSGVQPGTRRPWRPRTLVALLAGVLALVTLAVATPYVRVHGKEQAVARVKGAAGGAEGVEKAALAELGRHPADYLVFLTAAKKLSEPPALDLRRAVRFANRALYLNGASFQPHLITARLLRRLGRLGQAALEYRLVTRRNPILLEAVFDELSPLADSLRWLREVADTPDAQRRLARFLQGRGRVADASLVIEARLLDRPDDADAIVLAAQIDLLRRNFAAAAAWAVKLATLPGRAAEAAVLRGDALVGLGKRQEALTSFALARQADPLHVEAYLRAAALHVEQGAGAHAREVLEGLRRIDVRAASVPLFAILQARAYDTEKNLRRALREWRLVLAHDRGNQEAQGRIKVLEREVEHGGRGVE